MRNAISYNRGKGFTLLEILMVVAVVSALAAILFGIIGRAQENGRRTTCLNNLKLLSLGLQQYVQDNNSRFPTNLFPLEPLLPYVKSKKLFQCPSMSQIPNLYPRPDEHYALTPWLYVDLKAQQVQGRNVLGRHEATLTSTATAVSFYEFTGDEEREKIANTCGITEVGVRHFNGANYAFVDGHVKWLTSVEFAQLFCADIP